MTKQTSPAVEKALTAYVEAEKAFEIAIKENPYSVERVTSYQGNPVGR